MFRKFFRYAGASAVLAFTIGVPAAAQTNAVPPVPFDIQVPAGNTAFLKASAVGTQNYVCLPSAGGLVWTFQAPQATLFVTLRWFTGDVRQQIATHFLSPNPIEAGTARATWQSSADTSSVWARKIKESSDPAFVAPGAIPWFLLQVMGKQDGPTGGTMLTPTTFIQRVNTTGGTMAATSCTVAGGIMFVPYTADYIFYRANQ
jgi:hypothetical protein